MRPAWADQRRVLFRNEMIQRHVAGQNALASLHDNYGELYEQVIDLHEQQEQLLAAESMSATSVPAQVLRDTVERYERILKEKVPGLDEHICKVLAWGAVAEWMLRCPLDFEEVA